MVEEVKLLLAGDAMLGRGVNQVIRRHDPEYPLEQLAAITRNAGLFFTNLECAISPHDRLYSGPPKVFYFRADPPAAETLVYAGVDLVSLANNHALDAGYSGLLDTLAILEEKGIAQVGAGPDLNLAQQPAILEVNGVRLAVLGCCDHQDDFAAGEHRPGINYVDLSDPAAPDWLAGQVAVLAAQVDHVIVAFHWMPNWVPRIPEFYRRLGRLLIEAGARVIWGHSPHHFLGMEWIGPDVILYSTGGLVDDYALEPTFRNDRQLLFYMTLKRKAVAKVRALPIELGFARTAPATGEARAWIARRFSELCADAGSRVEQRGNWLDVLPDSLTQQNHG